MCSFTKIIDKTVNCNYDFIEIKIMNIRMKFWANSDPSLKWADINDDKICTGTDSTSRE